MTAYDYIIVGAGSAGSVLASRLTEDRDIRVLLLEEGPSDDNWMVRMPKGIGKMVKEERFVSRHQTTRTMGSGAPEVWVRGRTLGGSSSVNGMVWIWGQPEDYDRIEAMGNRGWGWETMAPYFKRLEDHEAGEDELHGAGGPIAVRTQEPSRLGDAFIAAGETLGLKRKSDQNLVDQEGVGYLQHNIDRRGRRSSAAMGYLAPARKRPNLTVLTGVRVQKVKIGDGRAVGVVATHDGRQAEFLTRGEVILSAGSIGSSRILLLSGVGPADHLKSVGVPVVRDLPGVGSNMREHFLMSVDFRLREASLSQNRSYGGAGLLANVARYYLTGGGVMSYGAYEAAAFVRTDPGLNRPDGQLMFASFSMDRATGRFHDYPGMHIFGYLLRPESQGTIRLTGADPGAPLAITPNYLDRPEDRRRSIDMIRYVRKLAGTPPLSDLVVEETGRLARARTDDEILHEFMQHGRSGMHACGVCAMGQGPEAVVDERLRVRGLKGLRVCDLSVFPEMLSGNTNAPTMALALRGADLFLEDRAKQPAAA